MKVLVIGATGATGRHLVRKLLERGQEVTALVRSPAPDIAQRDCLQLIVGDARDAAAVDRAVEGQEAVVVAFAPRSFKKDDLQETMMRNLIAAMKRHGVKRVVNLSAWGLNNEQAVPSSPIFRYFVRPVFLRHVWPDKQRSERLLAASGLDYVNVQPGRLLDLAARGGVRASVDGRGLRQMMNREDLAEFMVEQAAQSAWDGQSVIIGY